MCNFHVGYFKDTLPEFDKNVAFMFIDVDLKESLETCLEYLWPLLQDGCSCYTHEAHHMEIASIFFDRVWWHKLLGTDFPGLVGAGGGLGLSLSSGASYFGSCLGYIVKNSMKFEDKL